MSNCNDDCYASRHPDKPPIPCQFCGVPTHMAGTKCCEECWPVSRGLERFVRSRAGREYAKELLSKATSYDTNYGDARVCVCGHAYYRHFDPYEDMADVGCKYCDCFDFEEGD